MTILQKENNYGKINILEKLKIITAATLVNLPSDVISGRNNPLYRILHLVDRFQYDDQPEEWWKYLKN